MPSANAILRWVHTIVMLLLGNLGVLGSTDSVHSPIFLCFLKVGVHEAPAAARYYLLFVEGKVDCGLVGAQVDRHTR